MRRVGAVSNSVRPEQCPRTTNDLSMSPSAINGISDRLQRAWLECQNPKRSGKIRAPYKPNDLIDSGSLSSIGVPCKSASAMTKIPQTLVVDCPGEPHAVKSSISMGVPCKNAVALTDIRLPKENVERQLSTYTDIAMRSNYNLRRVQFIRYGDKYFNGAVLHISDELYKTIEDLLIKLSGMFKKHPECLGPVTGIYTIFKRRITFVSELKDAGTYICKFREDSVIEAPISTGNSLSHPVSEREWNHPMEYDDCSCSLPTPQYRLHQIVFIRDGPRPRYMTSMVIDDRGDLSTVVSGIVKLMRFSDGQCFKIYKQSGMSVLEYTDLIQGTVFFIYDSQNQCHLRDLVLDTWEKNTLHEIRKVFTRRRNNARTPAVEAVFPKLTLSKDFSCIPNPLPEALTDRYAVKGVLGKGQFGVTVQVVERQSSELYALKVCYMHESARQEYNKETVVMKTMKHCRLMPLMMDISDDRHVYLVLPFMDCDLGEPIVRYGPYDERRARVIMTFLCRGMLYIQSKGVIHRDLKPENIMVKVDGDGNVLDLKIADFGLACRAAKHRCERCGTPPYRAPEVIAGLRYSFEVDVWSCGVIMYVVLSGQLPFGETWWDDVSIYDAIVHKPLEFPDDLFQHVGGAGRGLMAKMLTKVPLARLGITDVIQNDWFRDGSSRRN